MIEIGLARKLAAAALGVLAIAAVSLLAYHRARPPQRCAPGMEALGPRCCGAGQALDEAGRCSGPPRSCSPSMRVTPDGCVPERRRVRIAGGHLELGPIDWEAAERVERVSTEVPAFFIDSHEVTEADYAACVAARRCPPAPTSGEPGRAQAHVDAGAAEAYCRWHNGALPSRDQLAFAAMGEGCLPSQSSSCSPARRYPWGATGAVCRRAAFGLAAGPCGEGATGPELAGSHPDGATPEGVHDLAGNVAEWARAEQGFQVRGGSWRSRGADELRSWSHAVVPRDLARDDVGFRCVYAERP